MSTKISWADESINPVVGCSKISPGCQNCYAEKMAVRLAAMGLRQYQEVATKFDRTTNWTGKTCFVPSELEKPYKWKAPRSIFVSSMGDLFHDSVEMEWIVDIYTMVYNIPRHQFIFLTKRPERMQSVLSRYPVLPNLAIGVSCENQGAADERIPLLLETPAARRFVSLEPLLGPVSIWGWHKNLCQAAPFKVIQPRIDSVILGGESGHKARYVDPDWVRLVRDECETAGIPFLFKQWDNESGPNPFYDDNGFPLLDGRTHTDLAWEVRK